MRARVRRRAERQGLSVSVVGGDMLGFSSPCRFDRVVFYECFHHCSDHVALVKKFDKLVSEGGRVVFAGEPMTNLVDLARQY